MTAPTLALLLLLLAGAPAPTTLDTVGAVLERTRGPGPHVVALVVVGNAQDLPDEASRAALMELVRAHPRVDELVVLPPVEPDPGRRALANLAAEHGVSYVLVLRVFPDGAPAQLELLDELGAVLPPAFPPPESSGPLPQVERTPIPVAEESQGVARMAAYMQQAWVVHWIPGAIPGLLPNRPMVTTATGAPVALERVATTPGASLRDRRALQRAAASQARSTQLLGWGAMVALAGGGALAVAPCLAGTLGALGGWGVGTLCAGDPYAGSGLGAITGALGALGALVVVLSATAFLWLWTLVPGVVLASEDGAATRQALHAAVGTHNTVLANGLGLDLEAAGVDPAGLDHPSSTAAPPTPGDAAAP